MTELIQQNLHRAQQRMKHQEDKHRQEREFLVGDWVFVKLQPYVQQSVQLRLVHKLSYKYFGPYLVLQRIGAVAYKLQLPSSSKIHPVFHVSQLKKALPLDTQALPDDQLTLLEATTTPSTYQVRDTAYKKVGNFAIPCALVQWGNSTAAWSSWENLHTLPQITTAASLMSPASAS